MDNRELKQISIIFIIGLLTLCLESLVLSSFTPISLVPHLQFLIVIFLAFYFGDQIALFASFFLGIVVDFFSSGAVGPTAGAHIVLFYLVYALSSKLFLDSWFSTGIVCFFGSVIGNIVSLFFESKFALSYVVTELNTIVKVSIFSGLIASVFFRIIRSVLKLDLYAKKI